MSTRTLPRNKRVGPPRWSRTAETSSRWTAATSPKAAVGSVKPNRSRARSVAGAAMTALQGVKPALGRFRQSLGPASLVIRTRVLPAVVRVSLVFLDALARAGEVVARLPWKEFLEWVLSAPVDLMKTLAPAFGKLAHARQVIPGTVSLTSLRKHRGAISIGLVLAGALSIFLLTICLLASKRSGAAPLVNDDPMRRVEVSSASGPSAARPETGQAVSPLVLEAGGPVEDVRTYVLRERPGLIVEVKSHGPGTVSGEIPSTHPLVRTIRALPFDGGTRFVLWTDETRPLPAYQIRTDDRRILIDLQPR